MSAANASACTQCRNVLSGTWGKQQQVPRLLQDSPHAEHIVCPSVKMPVLLLPCFATCIAASLLPMPCCNTCRVGGTTVRSKLPTLLC